MTKYLSVLLLFLLTHSVFGQTSDKDSLQLASGYSLTDIASKLQETEDLIQEAEGYINDPKIMDKVRSDYLETDSLLQITNSRIDTTTSSIVEINSILSELSILSTQIEGYEALMSSRTEDLDQFLQNLKREESIWKATLDKLKEDNSSKTVEKNVLDVLRKIDSMSKTLVTQIDEVFKYQNELSGARSSIAKEIEMLNTVRQNLSNRIYKVDALPLWKAGEDSIIYETFKNQITKNVQSAYKNVGTYVERNSNLFILNLIIIILLMILIIFLKVKQKKLINYNDQDALWIMFNHPVGLAILLGLLVFNPPYEFFPSSLAELLLLIVYLIVFYIVFPLVGKSARYFLTGLAVFLLLNTILSYADEYKVFARVLLLAESITGIYIIYAILRSGIKNYDFFQTPVAKWMLYLLPLGFFTFGTALVANILGATNFTEFLLYATVKSIAFGVLIFAGVLVLNGMIVIILRSPQANHIYLVKENAELLERRTIKWLQFGMLLFFLVTIAKEFELWDDVQAFILVILNYDLSLGSTEFTLLSILAFIITLLVSWWIAKLVRVILEKELFRRMDLPRGIPGAISTTIYYVILTFGFFLALTQSGFELTQLSIIVGALSVGIGFGLQNIISNFVSGIILAFERPVQEGDTVEIGTMMGEVKSIGIRASNVRTYDGSEVILPNNNLVSNEVINWTLSDRKRRSTIEVGVAYGSAPRKVAELLKKQALDYPKTLKDPEPLVIFNGFGDSSLNFKLHFWTYFEDGYTSKSEVSMIVYDALEEAGITIPFPQRVVTMAEAAKDDKPEESKSGEKKEKTPKSTGHGPESGEDA